jgi:hypothetical protein
MAAGPVKRRYSKLHRYLRLDGQAGTASYVVAKPAEELD